MNISAKFQLHPTYGFWWDGAFLYIFRKFSLSVAIKLSGFDKNYMFGKGLLNNISEKPLQKYLQRGSNKCNVSAIKFRGFGQKENMFDIGLLNKHFWKTSAKMSATRHQ